MVTNIWRHKIHNERKKVEEKTLQKLEHVFGLRIICLEFAKFTSVLFLCLLWWLPLVTLLVNMCIFSWLLNCLEVEWPTTNRISQIVDHWFYLVDHTVIKTVLGVFCSVQIAEYRRHRSMLSETVQDRTKVTMTDAPKSGHLQFSYSKPWSCINKRYTRVVP